MKCKLLSVLLLSSFSMIHASYTALKPSAQTAIAITVTADAVQAPGIASTPISIWQLSAEQRAEIEQERKARRMNTLAAASFALNNDINESQSKEVKLQKLADIKAQLTPALTVTNPRDQAILEIIESAGVRSCCCCFQYVKHAKLRDDLLNLKNNIDSLIIRENWNH